MKLAAALLLFCLVAAALPSSGTRLWFVYLVKGDGPRPADTAELKKMQKAHLDNFDKLYSEGKLVAAGPLKDPTGYRRGIVVVKASSQDQVLSYFKKDPYIQNRIMKVVGSPWSLDEHAFKGEIPDPNAIVENRLASITQVRAGSPDWALLERQENYLDAAAAKGTVSLAGRLLERDSYEAIVLIQGVDEALAKTILERSPLVQEGWAKVEFLPLWMAKGTLR